MFHNILNYDDDSQSRLRVSNLKTILEEVTPSLFLVCKLKSETVSDYMFTNAIQTKKFLKI